MRTAIDLGVNHISAYALTVEPTTKMGRQIAAGVLPKPDDDDEAAKYEIADELFSAAGLQWYEISNWARPGYESRHNLGYWRNVDWAGIGPGAHSHYNRVEPASCRSESERSAQPHGSSSQDCDAHGAIRSWDLAHPRLWSERVNAGQVPWAGSESITPMEALEETIMLGLRLREGLDLTALKTSLDVGGAASSDIDAGVAELEREGLVERRGSRLIPTLRGRLLNDAVIERMFDCCGL